MIDRLRRTAQAGDKLKKPLLLISFCCVGVSIFIVAISTSHEGDRFLFPTILGFLWFLSGYAFIETFQRVPNNARHIKGLFKWLKLKLARLLYWLIGFVFLGTTLAIVILSVRILSVWLREHGGS